MARYIDADKFIAELEQEKTVALDFGDGVAVYEIEHTMNLIGMQPTADVVPKSEADEIAEELSDTIVMKDELFDEVIKLRGELANAKAEVAREIFEEIDVLIDDWKHSRIQSIQFIAELAELKKKYTEGEE